MIEADFRLPPPGTYRKPKPARKLIRKKRNLTREQKDAINAKARAFRATPEGQEATRAINHRRNRRIHPRLNPEEMAAKKEASRLRKKHRDKLRERPTKTPQQLQRMRANDRERYVRNNEKEIKRLRMRAIRSTPIGTLTNRCRCRIASVFARGRMKKATTTQSMVGCEWEFLKAYIQSQFTKGMNWNNRSLWHVDHVIPLASAKTEDDLIRLCHYTNLRPMWAVDNFAKGDKIITCQPELPLALV